MPLPADDDLNVWIWELRARLARGDLVELAPLDLGDGPIGMPPELVVSIMLADVDHYDDLEPAQLQKPEVASRWYALCEDFRQLRRIIG